MIRVSKAENGAIYIKAALVFVLFTAAAGLIFYLPYRVMRHATIDAFNDQQELLAKQAAEGIERLFSHFETELTVLANENGIIHLNADGKKILEEYYDLKRSEIAAISRIDAKGRIIYTVPNRPEMIGKDVSGQLHNQEIRQHHVALISEVFTAVQGYRTIACLVPIFDGNRYDGSVTILIPFMNLAKEFISGIRLGNGGYGWMISRTGIELYCPVPGHTGHSVFDNFAGFPSVNAMAEAMMAGKKGRTVYVYDHIRDNIVPPVRKLAVFYPVHLPGNYWSIVVATPEEEALAPIAAFRCWWWGLLIILLLTIFGYTLFLVRSGIEKQKEATRLKVKEKALENERFLSRFINNTSLPIGIITVDGKVELLNSSLQKQYGYTMEDLPTIEDWFVMVYPDKDVRARVQKAWKIRILETLKTGVSVSSEEWTILCKDGTPRDVLFNYTMIEHRIVITFNDVTEKNRIRRKEQELQQQRDKARKMEAIGLMAGGVAHDLNNILSGIINYPELLLMKLPPDSEMRAPLQSIRESGERAAAVVADLLTVARGAANSREIVNLNNVVTDYMKSPEFDKLMSHHQQVQCTTRLAPDLHNISCSRIHMRKCLMNLVTNGVEAVEGRGRIVISTCNRQPGFIAKNGKFEDQVLLVVTDTGPGISDRDLEHIFEPFYSSKVMGMSGTGLGLTVVWNIVVVHGGTVNVDSGGHGTIFTLSFPAVEADLVEKSEDSGINQLQGHGERILIVDDEEQQRDIARQMLSMLGYRPESAASGEEAVDFLRDNPVDLVLLDMIMESGKMNGRQTYERILENYPGQKAIIVSGFAENKEVKLTLESGAYGFIKKPYSMAEFGRTIKEALAAEV
jgi:PAS domain S-box-containing protein